MFAAGPQRDIPNGMFAPRGAMPRPRTDSLDHTDQEDVRLLRWRDALLRQGKDELQSYPELQKIQEYTNMLDGKYYGVNRPLFRSNYFDNFLSDVRVESRAALSQVKPMLDIASKIEAYKKQAEVVQKYVQYLWVEESLDLEIANWVDHALFGTGFLKQVASDNNFFFSCHGLDEVIPVLCNGKIQESAAVIYRCYKPLSYFINKFGKDKCNGLEREATHLTSGQYGLDQSSRPGDISEYRWNSLSPAMRRRALLRRASAGSSAGSDVIPFPVIELQEIYSDDWTYNESLGHQDMWVHHPDLTKEEHNYHYIVPYGCRLYPRKRLTIFAGDKKMYDGPAPFWHGEYPFTMLQLNPCVWSPGGVSKYRDLVPLVKAINRTGAGIEEAVINAFNRCLIGKRGAVPQDVWDQIIPGKPGQKILVNPIFQRGDLSWMDSPTVPAAAAEAMKYWVATIKSRAGRSVDPQEMAKKRQVPGGEAQEQMRETMSQPFQLEGRYLEAAMVQSGKQLVSNIFQYATLNGRLRVLGQDGWTFQDFDFDPNVMTPYAGNREDHWRNFAIRIAPGSSHGASRMAKKNEAVTLFKSGGLSLAGLYRQLEYPEDVNQVMKEMIEEREKGVLPSGKQPRSAGQKRGTSAI